MAQPPVTEYWSYPRAHDFICNSEVVWILKPKYQRIKKYRHLESEAAAFAEKNLPSIVYLPKAIFKALNRAIL